MKTKSSARNRTRTARGHAPARGRSGLVGGVVGGAMIAGTVAGCFSAPALAGPEGQEVVHGTAEFITDGAYTQITTSHIAIINYDAFNIGSGETVRFIQPGSTSRVLNRINGAAPTHIHGNLMANGQVYFANSAGVVFHQGSVVNVGNLYAAAGNISNANFLNGINHFTDVEGSVVNRGEIYATGSVNLIGHSVQNFGTVVAEDAVTMVSGNDVLIGKRGGRVFARIEGAPAPNAGANPDPAGVHHHGAVVSRNGQVYFGVGDAFAMAAYSGSSIQAPDVTLAGGADSVTTVAGAIDASGGGVGETGGSVTITGDLIHLDGATIDASGHSGGGTVLVGGDVRGSGDMLKARGILMTEDASISVDADVVGHAGKAVLFASDATYFAGTVTARGGALGGDGGFVEVSGLENVFFKGAVNTLATNGRSGTLLIDPRDITIVASGAADTITGNVSFADFMGSNDAEFNAGDIQTLLATNGALILEAHRDIVFSDSAGAVVIDVPAEGGAFSSANFTLTAGRDITMATGTVIDLGATGVFAATINSNAADASIRNVDDTTAADFVMTGTAAVTAGGGFSVTQGANTSDFVAGGVTLGTVNAAAGNITVTGILGDVTIGNALTSGGAVNIASTGGNIVFNGVASGITANSDNPGNNSAGFISLSASGQIQVNSGSNPTLQASGQGGRVSLAADEISIGDNTGAVEGLSIQAGPTGAVTTAGAIDLDIRALTLQTDGDIQLTTGAVGNGFAGTVTVSPRANVDIGTPATADLRLSNAVLSNISTDSLVVSGSTGTTLASFGGLDQTAGMAFENITNLRVSLTAAGSDIVGDANASTFDSGSLVLEANDQVTLNGAIASTAAGGVSIFAGGALNVNALVTAGSAVISTPDINFTGAENAVAFNVSGATQILNNGEILLSDSVTGGAGTLVLTEAILSRFVSANGATQALQIGGTASIGTQTSLSTGTITVNGIAEYSTTFAGAVNRGVELTASTAGSDITFSGTNGFITLAATANDEVSFGAGTTTVSGTSAGSAFSATATNGNINLLGGATLVATNDGITLNADGEAFEVGAGTQVLTSGVEGITLTGGDVQLDTETAPGGGNLTLNAGAGITTGNITLGTGSLAAVFSGALGTDAAAFGDITAGAVAISGTGTDDALTVSSANTGTGILSFTALDALTLGAGGASAGGAVTLEADTMTLSGAVSGTTMNIRQTIEGVGIVLGSGSAAANTLLLTNADLALLTTTGDLTIGDPSSGAPVRTVSITLDSISAAAFANVGGVLNLTANGTSGDVIVQTAASTLGDTVITASDTINVASGGIVLGADGDLVLRAPTVTVAAAIDGSAGGATGTTVLFDTDAIGITAAVSPTLRTTFLSLSNETIGIGGGVGALAISAADIGNVTTGTLVFGDNDGQTTAVGVGPSIGTAFNGRAVEIYADGAGAGSTITIAPGGSLAVGSLIASTDGTIGITSSGTISATTIISLDAPTVISNVAAYTGAGINLGRAGGTNTLQAANNSFTAAGGTVTLSGATSSGNTDLTIGGGVLNLGGGSLNLGTGDFNATGATIAIGADADVTGSGAATQITQTTLDSLTANNVNVGDSGTTAITSFGTTLDGSGAGQTIAGISTFTTNGTGTTFQGSTADAAMANAFTGLTVAGSTGSVVLTTNVTANNAASGVDIDAGTGGISFAGGAITSSGDVNLNAGAAGDGGTLITSTAGNGITVTADGAVVFQDDAMSMGAITVSIDNDNNAAVAGNAFQDLVATNAITLSTGTAAADTLAVNGVMTGASVGVTGGVNTFAGAITSNAGAVTITGTSQFDASGTAISATGGAVSHSGGLATFTQNTAGVVTAGQGVTFFNGLALNGNGTFTVDTTNSGGSAAGANVLLAGGITAANASDVTLLGGTGGAVSFVNGTAGSSGAGLGDVLVGSAGAVSVLTTDFFADSFTQDGAGTFALGNGTQTVQMTLAGSNGSGLAFDINSLGINTINTNATINTTTAGVEIFGATNLGGSVLTTDQAITFGSGGANGDIVLISGATAQLRAAAAGVAAGGANITVNGSISNVGIPGNLTAAAGANTFTVTGVMGTSGAVLGDIAVTGAAQIAGAVFADSFIMDAASATADTDFMGTVTVSGDDGSGRAFVARGNDIAVGAVDASTASGTVSLLGNGTGSAVHLGGDITTNNQAVAIQGVTTTVETGAAFAIDAGTAGVSLLGGGVASTFDTMGQDVTITSNTPDFDGTVTVVDTMSGADTLTFLGAAATSDFFLAATGGTAGTDVIIDAATLQAIQASVDGVVFGAGTGSRNLTAGNALLLTDITANAGTGTLTVNGTFGVDTAAAAAGVTVNGATVVDATGGNATLQGNGGAFDLNGALTLNAGANAASLRSDGGAIDVMGAVTVAGAGASTIDSADAADAVNAGSITLNAGVNGTGNAGTLTVTSDSATMSDGAISIAGSVGDTSELDAFTVDAGGSTITLGGTQVIADAQDYTAATYTLSATGTPLSFVSNGAGAIAFNGGTIGVATGSDLTVNNTMGDVTLAALTFAEAGRTLNATATGGTMSLAGIGTGGTTLAAINLTAEEMQLSANIFGNVIGLASAGDIVLGSATNAAGAPNELTAAELDFVNAGAAVVTVTSTGGSISTESAYTFGNALNLVANTAGNGVTFNGAWSFGGALVAEGPAIAVNADLTSTVASSGATQNAAFTIGTGTGSSSASGAITLGGDLTANGNITLGNGATTITVSGARTVSTAAGNGAIDICGPIVAANAMSSLTLDSGDTGVGAGLRIGSMTGFDTISLSSAGTITFKGTDYTSTGAQSFTGTGFVLNSGGGTVSFASSGSGVVFTGLGVGDGNITEAMGDEQALSISGTTIAVNSVTTSFDQVYTGALQLNGDLTTVGNPAADVLLGFGGPVLGTSITVNGATTLSTNATVTTSDDAANSNDAVTFNGTIDGGTNTLTVNSSGDILYAGDISNLSAFSSTATGNDIEFRLASVAADAQSYAAGTYTTTGTGMTPTLTFAGDGITFTGGAIQAPTASTTLIFNGGTGTTTLVGIDGTGAGSVADLQVRGTDVALGGAIDAAQVLFAHTDASGTVNINGGTGYVLSEAELRFVTDSAATPVLLVIGEATNAVAVQADTALTNLTSGTYRVAGATYANSGFTFSTSGAAIELTSAGSTLTNSTHASNGGAISVSGTNLFMTDSAIDATNMFGTGGAITISSATGINGAVAISGDAAVTLGVTNGLAANQGDLTVTGAGITLGGNSLGVTNAVNSVVLNSTSGVSLLTVNSATSQTYNTALSLLDGAALTNTAGAVAFNQGVDLAGSATVTNGGSVAFADTLSGATTSALTVNQTAAADVSFQQVGAPGARFMDLTVNNATGTTTFNQDVFLSGTLDTDNATAGAVRSYIFEVATLVWDGTIDFTSSQNVSLTLGSAVIGTGGTANFGDGNLTVTDNANTGAGVTFAGATTLGAGATSITSDAGLMFGDSLTHGAGTFTSTSTSATFMGDVVVAGNNQTAFNIGTGESGGAIAFGAEVGTTDERLQSLVVNTDGELQFTNATSQGVHLVNGLLIDGVNSSASAVRTTGQTTIDTSLAAAGGSIVIAADLLGSSGSNDGFTFIVDRSLGELLAEGAFGGAINREMPVIRINGNVGSMSSADALADLRFNTNGGSINGRDFVPANATVVFGDPATFGSEGSPDGANITVSLTGDFTMGQNEKLVALGDLAVSAANATVGDMIATGTLDFSGITGTTFFLTRDPGTLLPGDSQIPVTDLGIDIIADELIFNLSGSASSFVLGSGNSPIFADSDAFVPGAEGFGLTIALFQGELREQVLTLDGVTVDTLFSGTSRENVSEAIAGAVPREAQSGDVGNDTSAGTARRDELERIGIFPKFSVQELVDNGEFAQAAELMGEILDSLRGRSLYDDSLDIENYAQGTGITNMSRLQLELVTDVLDSYNALVFVEVPDPNNPGQTRPQNQVTEIRGAIEDSVLNYFDSIPEDQDFTVASFEAFLQGDGNEQTRAYLLQIGELIEQIQVLGLTRYEVANVYNQVINPLFGEFRQELFQYFSIPTN